MKINEHEIAKSAKRLRDAENSQLHIKPWHSRRMSIPSWLVFIPAAALLGFYFGMRFQIEESSADVLAMSKPDTVYVDRVERITEYDTIYRMLPPRKSKSTDSYETMTGVPVSADNIPYELLVMQ